MYENWMTFIRIISSVYILSVTTNNPPWMCMDQMIKAINTYPHHHPETVLANLNAGREIWDSNGDQW